MLRASCILAGGHGLDVGRHADLAPLLQAGDPIEALRLRATRLMVWLSGQLVAHSPAATTTLSLPGKAQNTNLRLLGLRP